MADLKFIKPLGVQNIINKFCLTIGMIPSSYKLSLSYEEQILSIGKYLEETVIPALNNNAEAVAELQSLFVQLKDYVENYFDNLDVQNEINNKLEEMLEDGTLIEIITSYLEISGMLCFNNINEMKQATNLINGSFVKTFGFHSLNDKGGNLYKIRTITNEDIIDEISIISINSTNNLIAELIETPKMYVEQYGAYGNGVNDDSEYIQYAINKHLYGTVNFSEGTYLISSPIKTFIDNNKQSNIIMEKTTVIKSNTEIECLFELGGLGGNNEGVKNRLRFFKNGVLDATNCEAGIKINGEAMGIVIDGVEIKNFKTYGIYMPRASTLYSSDISFNHIYINGNGSNKSNYGFYIERPDNKFEDLRVNAIQTAFYCTQGGQILHSVHGLVIGDGTQETNEWFSNTKFFVMTSGGINILNQCYCDSFSTFVESSSPNAFILTNSAYFSYINNVDANLFIFNSGECRYTIANNTFEMQTPATKHRGIIYNQWNNQVSTRKQLVKIFDNQISDIRKFTEGDLLCQENDSIVPFWLNSNTKLNNTQWLNIGYVIPSYYYQQLKLNINGYEFIANYKLERFGTNTYVTHVRSSKTNPDVTIQLGFKYVGNINGYPIYKVAVRQTAGDLLNIDMEINNLNKNSPFMPINLTPYDPSFYEDTMDGTYNI